VTTPFPRLDKARPHLVRVLLADDHPAVLALATATLAVTCLVVGAVENGRELLAAVKKLCPEVVVLDISMPEINGLEAALELRCTHPGIKIVFLTVYEDPDYVRATFAAGGLGYVVKSRLASDLLPAVRAAFEGHRFLSPTVHLGEEA
jgi:DNA-binding NarL/FixJ family response regulator